MKTEYSFKNLCKNSFLKLKNILNGSLFIIIMGVFLLPNTAFLSDITPETIIAQTNKKRLEENRIALSTNEYLSKAAIEKANSIFAAQKFQHDIDGHSFSAWIKNTGYQYSFAGENLAIDFVTAEGTIDAWLNSPSHKKNLLNERYKEIGVAVLEGNFNGKKSILVVQIFGTPAAPLDNGSNLHNFSSTLNQAAIPDAFRTNLNTSSSQFLINSIVTELPNKNTSNSEFGGGNGSGQIQNIFILKLNNLRFSLSKINPVDLLYAYYAISLFGLVFLSIKIVSHKRIKNYIEK